MVKFTVSDGSTGGRAEWPAMEDVDLLLKTAEFMPAEGDYSDRIRFDFEVTGGEDAEEATDADGQVIVGQTWSVYANMPQGREGKLSPRSNLYQLLEGMSGGDFDPDEEIDTDDYEGKRFRGDFNRVQAQERVETNGKAIFRPKFDANGKPVKKTKLENVRPARKRKSAQRDFDWENEEAAS